MEAAGREQEKRVCFLFPQDERQEPLMRAQTGQRQGRGKTERFSPSEGAGVALQAAGEREEAQKETRAAMAATWTE